MLFSNPEVASYMNDHFVCAWESVRPVPRVEIDFGDGHKMTRTLNGNVITFLCTPDGRVFDILPGLYSADGYLAGLRRANELYETFASERWEGAFAERVAAYHMLAQSGVERIAVMPDGRLLADAGEMRYASKAMIEEPMKVLIAGGLDTPEARFATGGSERIDLDEALTMSKRGIERPVKKAIALESERLLAMDTEINERLRREQLHGLLTGVVLPTPEEISTWIYENVLHVAVRDPHLGLGRVIFGAEGETR